MKRMVLLFLSAVLVVSVASRAFAWRGGYGGGYYHGPMGSEVYRGPAGGVAARGPGGSTAYRGPAGGAVYRGPEGGSAYRAPSYVTVMPRATDPIAGAAAVGAVRDVTSAYRPSPYYAPPAVIGPSCGYDPYPAC